MKIRAYISMVLLFLILAYGTTVLYFTSDNREFLKASVNQSSRKITLYSKTGTIYDRNLKPLIYEENALYALVSPDAITLNLIKPALSEDLDLNKAVKEGLPLLLKADYKIDSDNITFLSLPERYNNNQIFSNMIGYLNGNSEPVTGIEKEAQDILNKYNGDLSLTYSTDSLGRMILGEETKITDNLNNDGGIVLTLDKELQAYSENVGKEIEKGAIVILSVPDAEILTMASFPPFDSSCPQDFLENEGSPFTDKCTSSFAPGSVFKLVIAAAALNEDLDINNIYTCHGVTYSDNMAFSCFGGFSHGDMDLNSALANSCNCYFMNLSKKLSPFSMISAALNFGISSKTEIFPDIFSEKGNIPNESELKNNRALSNFSIGQGEVTVTPLQAAAMINTVASNGLYTSPYLYKGETDNGKEITSPYKSPLSVRSFKISDSLKLENFMASAVDYGTAKKGKSENYKAYAKTGTAETGIYKDGSELLNYWYAGFIELDNGKRYVITVLNAEAEENDNPTGEIFKVIGEYIAAYYG